jgi:hypothetical protein
LVALGLALGIVCLGAWAATSKEDDTRSDVAERKRLVTRRDKLLNDLVRLERDRHQGKVDDRRYAVRREELVASLELVYGALDSGDAGPGPATRTGLAA